MTTYSRNDFKPPNLNTVQGSNFRTAGNSSSGIVSSSIPVVKPWENQPAIYQVDTTYGSNFSTDHGENDRKRQKEKMIMNKFRNSVEPFLTSQPTFSKQYNTGRIHIDNRIHEMLTNHTINSPKLWNPNINAELDFNKKDFQFKSGQVTPPQFQREKKDKVSPLNDK